jgi:ribosomal protein S12 methylthiotransferase accessory factor YcaO
MHAAATRVYLLLMKPSTDYIRHAARLARKLHMDAAMGAGAQPDAEFYKALAKALEEIAAGLEQVATRE